MSFIDLPIKRKQTLILLLSSTGALLLACAGFIAWDAFTFRKNMISNLDTLAAIIGDSIAAPAFFQDEKDAEDAIQTLSRKPNIVASCVYTTNGVHLATYSNGSGPPQIPEKVPPPTQATFADNGLVSVRPIIYHNEPAGTIYLRSDIEELKERLKQYVSITVGVLFVSTLFALILSARLQRVISDPILRLAQAAHSISIDKNYSLRVPSHGRDEIGQLTGAFNEMLTQIQDRDAALQKAHDDLEIRVFERTRELQQEVIDRKRAEEALQQQLRRTSLLNSITRAIIARQDLGSISFVLLSELENQFAAELSAICLFDPESHAISSVACRKKGQDPNHPINLFSESLSLADLGWSPDATPGLVNWHHTQQVSHPIAQKIAALQLCSAVLAPLLVEKDFFGVLLIARSAPGAFAENDVEFLQMLSQEVALAAHQYRLHSELQKAYDDLRQTQEAVMQQERLRALGQMASGIAHDVNNALTPIVTYAELLLRAEPNLSGTSIKNLQIIKTAGEDIAHIVSRMREFYRHRDMHDAVSSVQLNKLAGQVVDLTRPRWRDIPQARGFVIDMQLDFQSQLPHVLGNESEIREALTNLILNAVDAMPRGGKLTIRTALRPPNPSRPEQASPRITLEVCDTGHGMDEQTCKRCLEPFFSTKGQRGTGLGLAMVYGVMQRHGGTIEIDTKLDHGTTMRLVFPIPDSIPLPATQLPAHGIAAVPLKVLCVDDEPLLRDVLRQILESGGHRPVLADGGVAGLELFRNAKTAGQPFDVVITDLGMPHLDGRQFAKSIKKESPNTPVILLTGWGKFMQEDGDIPSEIDGVLSKPPRLNELYSMLDEVLHPKPKP